MIKQILRDRNFQLAIILTILFFGTGIAFLFFGLVNYSWILFVLLPIALGVAIGAMPKTKYLIVGAVVTATLILLSMYIEGLSGLICIVMVLPIIVPLIFLGYVITNLIKRYRKIKDTNKLPVLLLPLVPFLIAAPLEHFIVKDKEAIIEVRTERVLNFTPEQVYDAIIAVDTLDAEKPFLMTLDLPVPVKCSVDKEQIGGTRTCYFKSGRLSYADFGSGTITEKITALQRGKVLKMDVTDYHLVGRNWLGFKEAIYYFEKAGDTGCKITRVTTYTSVLRPRIYWEPMERLGVQQEHEYVLNNLQKSLQQKFGHQ